MSGIKSGDIVNWRTKNGRGNPCSRRAEAVAEAEYDVICGDECVASASGPKEDAWLEAMQYAQQYQADGKIEIWEVTRRKVWPNESSSAAALGGKGQP